MPAALSAPAAAPARACLRVSRISACPWADEHEAPQHPVEIAARLRVRDRRRDVLAHGVQRAATAPCVEDVPLVRVLIDGVDRGVDAVRTDVAARVAEARDPLALLRVRVDALRNRSTSRIAAQVHVQLAAGGARARLLPDPALEIAPVA